MLKIMFSNFLRMFRFLLFAGLLGVAGLITPSVNAVAQPINQDSLEIRLQDLFDQLEENLNDIPLTLRRAAVFRIERDEELFTASDANYIRNQVEGILKANSSLTLLSPLELQPTDAVKIIASDTTLQISSQKGRSFADLNLDKLLETAREYNVQGLVEISVFRRSVLGLVLTVRIISAESLELLWSKTVESYPPPAKPEPEDSSRTSMLSVGLFSYTGAFLEDGVKRQDIDQSVTMLHTTLHGYFMQPMQSTYDSYFGLFAGGNFSTTISDSIQARDLVMLDVGMLYRVAITPYNSFRGANPLWITSSLMVSVPLIGEKGYLFTLSPVNLLVHFTRNFSLAIEPRLIVGENDITYGKSTDVILFDRFNYGFKFIYTF